MAENIKDSMLGIIAVGQCGGNIGQLLHDKDFKTFFINSSESDLGLLENVDPSLKHHIDGAVGAGHDRKIARTLLKQDFKNIMYKIDEVFSNQKLIYFVFSAGGGTGSGLGMYLCSMLAAKDKSRKYGAIIVIPSIKQVAEYQKNAYDCLNELLDVQDELISYFIVDNNAGIPEIINEDFVARFDEMCNTTMYSSNKGNIDPSDLLKALYRKGMAECVFAPNKEKASQIIEDFDKNNIFAPLEKDKAVEAMVTITPSEIEADVLINRFGEPDKMASGYCEQSEEKNSFLLLTGLTFPFTRYKEIEKKVEDHKKIKDARKTDNRKSNLDLDWFDDEDETPIGIVPNTKEVKSDFKSKFDEFADFLDI